MIDSTVFDSPLSTSAPSSALSIMRARSRATGAIVMTGFSALWAAGGLMAARAPEWVMLIVALVAGALVAQGLRIRKRYPLVAGPLPADVEGKIRRSRRLFRWITLGEVVGILLAVNVLANVGLAAWQTPAVMTVVGLHFFPLAAAFRHPPHAVTGAALTAWALTYPWLLPSGPMAPVGAWGAATILLVSAVWALRATSGRMGT